MAIRASIISLKDGYTHLENLKAIRIISTNYNILIMDDYVPIIGEVKGSIAFESKDGTVKAFQNVHGYYRHCRNEFSFMMEV